jgi:hypothetical protein
MTCGPGCVVGIATGYGLDGSGIKFRWRRDFPYLSRPAPVVHLASCTMGTGSFSGVKSGRGVTLTPHPLLVQSYTSTPPMGCTACTEPECLYKGDLYLYIQCIILFRVPVTHFHLTVYRGFASTNSCLRRNDLGFSKSRQFPNWVFYGFVCNLLREVPTYPALINLSAESLVSFISR